MFNTTIIQLRLPVATLLGLMIVKGILGCHAGTCCQTNRTHGDDVETTSLLLLGVHLLTALGISHCRGGGRLFAGHPRHESSTGLFGSSDRAGGQSTGGRHIATRGRGSAW